MRLPGMGRDSVNARTQGCVAVGCATLNVSRRVHTMTTSIIKRLWGYRAFEGYRIAWKIGDLTGEEPHGRLEGQFCISLEFNVDSGTFRKFTPPGERPFRTLAEYVDHSFSIMLWRWGIWIAIRGREAK